MQLKGLIKFFTILLIVVCLFQLSYSVFLNKYEAKLEAKVKKQMAGFKKPAEMYPNNALAQAQYADSLKNIEEAFLARAKDSSKNKVITYGVEGKVTYQDAQRKQLNLGLDLQGGIAVTLEVGVDEMIKKRSLNPNDEGLNKAIALAAQKKAKTGKSLISVFGESFKETNPNVKLASLFMNPNRNKLTLNDSDAEVLKWLDGETSSALISTKEILEKRVNKFGVASTAISLDKEQGIINVELPGAKDPAIVRKTLQATAKLQFFETYTESDKLQDFFTKVDAAVIAYNRGDATVDTSNKETPFRSLFLPPSDRATLGDVNVSDTAILNRYLNYPNVKALIPTDLKFMYGYSAANKDPKNIVKVAMFPIKRFIPGSDDARLEGDKVIEADNDFGQTGKPEVRLKMNDAGADIWADMTKKVAENKGNIAIALDDFVYSAPTCSQEIKGGNTVISGNFSVADATDLSSALRTGKLDAPARITQESVVGPSLGQDAVKGGILSFAIAFGVIFLLMLVYYSSAGWVANIALVFNLIFTVGVLGAFGGVLTAAGIAGLVLTIGMAVDTNVIIFERIKEELIKGKNHKDAVDAGYKNSMAPVLDAHVTSFLTALILFLFGSGAVLGFATTQMLGIVLSLFCGILLSRLITDIWMNKNRHFEYFTGISKKIFKHATFKFIEWRKYAYMISAVVLALGIASFFYGFDQGVEYKGGRSFTIDFKPKTEINDNAKNITLDNIRADLKVAFGDNVVVKTVDKASQLDITTSYLVNEADPLKQNDSIVEAKLFVGLKKYLPANITYQNFNDVYKKGSKKVEASISENLKSGAWKSTLIAIFIITLYIFIRFRDWRYSVGTIIALLHDILVTLAVFSFCRKIMPFPLEIDQHFIAAVLTVAGFSMNDTVIVFDRVREYARKKVGASKTEIINTAINDTLSRTIMTSLTVFITLLILFIFGGEVTRGFSFAMLVGVITGTYSSIFVAAPILIDFAKHKPLGKSSAESDDLHVEDPTVMK